MNCSPPGSSVHGVLQARILEWVAPVGSPRGSSQPKGAVYVSCIAGGFLTAEPLGNSFYWITVGPAAAAKSRQSCLTLCDSIDGSPPGSPVPGILRAKTLEWVAISLFNAWKWKVKVKSLSRVRLFATPWTAAYQAPQPTGFPRQEYWSGVPSPSPQCALIQHNWCPCKKREVCMATDREKKHTQREDVYVKIKPNWSSDGSMNGEWLLISTAFLSRVMKILWNYIVVVVVQVCEYTKTYQTVHF